MKKLANADIQYLTGIGPKRGELLKKQFGIHTFYDLLYYFPFRYLDRSMFHHIADLRGAELAYVQLRGRFISFNVVGEGARRRLTSLFTDGTGTIEVVWFNSVRTLKDAYSTGVEYVLFGKPTIYGHSYNLVHPEVDKATEVAGQSGGLQGIYSIPETARNRGVSQRMMRTYVERLLATPLVANLGETLPADLIARHHLMPFKDALRAIHSPKSTAELEAAQMRLKYEELFYLQIDILKFAKNRSANIRGFVFHKVGKYFNDFYHRVLPFPLTGAQKRVIKEIREDMRSGRQMNRLLQGDVGSGKTMVALMVMLLGIDNGYQTCIMAPTEILATQHYETIKAWAGAVGVNVALLTGSTRKAERTRIHEQLLSGELQLLVGTHAVIEETVQFHNLGVAIIDEQHRFGVAQRARLWRKNSVPPHVLVMTATPIPRTLAMTVYGDLDVSVIDELPPGRKPVHTVMRTDQSRLAVYQFVAEQLRAGRQAYIVYPLIKENEKLDLKSLDDGYDLVRETFPSFRVCKVHGQMKPAEKDYQMQLFASGEAQILVATTVIEVGVNVPNASVMIVENAERFGLSQLHQLRGRVGRGADQSYCILMSKVKMTKETRHRLNVMTQTNDGFVVAEEDMKLRGPGDMEGTQQSGIALNLRIADIARDGSLIQLARDDARRIIDADPQLTLPQNALVKSEHNRLFDRKVDWSKIS